MLQLEYVRAITNGAKISVSQQILIHDEADGFNPTGATNCHQLPITARHQTYLVSMRQLQHRLFIKRPSRDMHHSDTGATQKFSDYRFQLNPGSVVQRAFLRRDVG